MAVPILLSLIAAGCGKKGDPLPPLRLEPGRIADLTAHRVDERIELRFTVPATNADGSTPPVVELIEIYRASTPAASPAPTMSQVIEPDHRRATYTIRGEDAPRATPAAPDVRVVAPGETVTFIDGIDPAVKPYTPDAPVWRYIVVGVARGGRRGPASAITAVPLADTVAPGPQPVITFDERAVSMTWPAGEQTEGRFFRVYQVESAEKAAVGKLVSDAKLDKSEFSTAVEFGAERCYVVRMAVVRESTTIEGPPGPAVCVTPVDKFPPPVPTGFIAAPNVGVVTLIWNPVETKDLAGYLILRGEGAGETLQPLMKEPVTAATHRDTTAKPGTTYTYAAVAIDRAGNQSAPSERQVVQAR